MKNHEHAPAARAGKPHLLLAVAAAILVASSGAFAQGVQLGAPVLVMDPKAGMPMFSIQLPPGWTYTSDSIWDRKANPMVNFSMEAKSPDGMEGLTIFPKMGFTDAPGMPGSLKVMTPTQFIHFFVEQMKKTNPQFAALNYRIVQAQDLPVPPEHARMAQANMTSVALGRAVGEYVENGVPKTAATRIVITSMGDNRVRSWIVSMGTLSGKRGSPEYLDQKIVAIDDSVRMNPQWEQKKAAMLQQYVNQNASETAGIVSNTLAQSRAAQRQREEMNRIHQQREEERRATFSRRAEANSRAMERGTDVLTDRDNRTNPYTGEQFKSDVNTEHVWVSSDGRRIDSNNSTYNPNYDSNVSGDWRPAPKGY